MGVKSKHWPWICHHSAAEIQQHTKHSLNDPVFMNRLTWFQNKLIFYEYNTQTPIKTWILSIPLEVGVKECWFCPHSHHQNRKLNQHSATQEKNYYFEVIWATLWWAHRVAYFRVDHFQVSLKSVTRHRADKLMNFITLWTHRGVLTYCFDEFSLLVPKRGGTPAMTRYP